MEIEQGNASAANRLEKIRFLLTESQLLDSCDVVCAQNKVYKQRRHPGWLKEPASERRALSL